MLKGKKKQPEKIKQISVLHSIYGRYFRMSTLDID
jgi:intein-encoded DNA endonuclease-like protein